MGQSATSFAVAPVKQFTPVIPNMSNPSSSFSVLFWDLDGLRVAGLVSGSGHGTSFHRTCFIIHHCRDHDRCRTMGEKMITNRFFFFFDPLPVPVKTTRILQTTPEFQKMAIMIFLSELILSFFAVKQRIGGYERGEERKEKREERRRCGLRYNVLSRAVLSCAVDKYIFLLFEGCDLPQSFSLLHVAVSSTSFTFTISNTFSEHEYMCVCVRVRMRLCVCV